MSVYDTTISKIQQLPAPLVEQVNDFVEFLLVKHSDSRWQLWTQFTEAIEIAESDYLVNLEDYENRLARGEILW